MPGRPGQNGGADQGGGGGGAKTGGPGGEPFGKPGTLGSGGDGGWYTSQVASGGGGGGGYYGGGGGGAMFDPFTAAPAPGRSPVDGAGGGGGGSSFIEPSAVETSIGTATRPSSVTIAYSKLPSQVNVTGAPNPALWNQSLVLTATVTSSAPQVPLTGTVSFLDNGTLLGAPHPVSSTGNGAYAASLNLPSLPAAVHTITATYNGDSTYESSASLPYQQQVVYPTFTLTQLTSSPNPSARGQAVTFTATVVPQRERSYAPTGTVRFVLGSTVLGTARVALPAGKRDVQATVTVNDLPFTADVVALYSGDAFFEESHSPPVHQVVRG